MNTAIATVAKDINTTVTGIQTAITMYALVMASLMITGGRVGEIVGRKRAFSVGCVVYACGSMTTALSQSLPMLLFGWSLLEGLGAVLIRMATRTRPSPVQPPESMVNGLNSSTGRDSETCSLWTRIGTRSRHACGS